MKHSIHYAILLIALIFTQLLNAQDEIFDLTPA